MSESWSQVGCRRVSYKTIDYNRRLHLYMACTKHQDRCVLLNKILLKQPLVKLASATEAFGVSAPSARNCIHTYCFVLLLSLIMYLKRLLKTSWTNCYSIYGRRSVHHRPRHRHPTSPIRFATYDTLLNVIWLINWLIDGLFFHKKPRTRSHKSSPF